MTLDVPKIFKSNDVISFINNMQVIFKMQESMTPNVRIDLTKIKQISALGILVIYKVIEYTYVNNCFKKPELNVNEYIQQKWKEYGFYDLIHLYVSNKDIAEKGYKDLSIKLQDKFFIAPQALLRSDNYSKEMIEKKFLPPIRKYYKDSPKIVSMVFLCLSEILLNFWEHAVSDMRSIIVAEGNKSNIEIICADTGDGIISTLGGSYKEHKFTPIDIIRKSVEKGETSKKMSNHMGYGLWILNEMTTRVRGRLHLYSQGVYLKNENSKILTGKSGYWQGTIIYLSLPLNNPITLTDIESYVDNGQIKLNMV